MLHLTILLSWLILSFLSSCGNKATLIVVQSPYSVTVKEGETIRMQCCWGGIPNMQRVRLKWRKNTTHHDDIIDALTSDKPHVKTGKYSSHVSGNCSNFSISSVLPNDTGIFFCTIIVEIPDHECGNGNGTLITVERSNISSTAVPLDSIPLAAFLIPLAVVMGTLCLCAFLCYWRKRKLMPYPGQASGKVGMIIHETPHGEGEEMVEQEGVMVLAENENSPGSSHGSTQWCAVPVYESFNYFAVQTSEDG